MQETYESISNKTKQIIATVFEINITDIKPTTDLIRDLQADSLDMMVLTQKIDTAFGIHINEIDLYDIHTVNDFITLVSNTIMGKKFQKYNIKLLQQNIQKYKEQIDIRNQEISNRVIEIRDLERRMNESKKQLNQLLRKNKSK